MTTLTAHHSQANDGYCRFANDEAICTDYLREVRRSKENGIYRINLDPSSSNNNSTRQKAMSPYLQKLPHSNLLQQILPPSSLLTIGSSRNHTRRQRATNSANRHHQRLSSAHQSKETNDIYQPSS
ncbi:unnamed protein product, partial [Didymodactylos carnosus]